MKTGFPMGGTGGTGKGYGKFQAIPDFGIGWDALMLGTKMTSTPGTNLFAGLTGAAGNSTVVGAPDASGLTATGSVVTGTITGTSPNQVLTVTVNATAPAKPAVNDLLYAGGALVGKILSITSVDGNGLGTYALAPGATNVALTTIATVGASIVFPSTPRALFNTASAATLWAVVKTPISQGIIDDFGATPGTGAMSLLGNTILGCQAYSKDAAAQQCNTSQADASANTAWTLMMAIFTLTTAQAFTFRTVTGRVTPGPSSAKASGAVGNDTQPHMFGRVYGSAAPAAKVAMCGRYAGALTLTSGGQADQLQAAAVLAMTDIGEVL